MESGIRRGESSAAGRGVWVVGAAVVGIIVLLAGVVLGVSASAQGVSIGSVTGFGGATPVGAPPGNQLAAPLVGLASTSSGHGYWLLGADGGVFAYGDAHFYGSAPTNGEGGLFVGIAATPDGGGYWLVDYGGYVESFGDAANVEELGDMGVFPDAPVVGIAATHTTSGVWLAGADGGVFTLGGAHFYGSMGNTRLNSPVVGMASTPDGKGYWLAAADGGVFSFGDAHFHGSMGSTRLNSPVTGMASTPDGKGYWLVAADGGEFSFGDAHFYGSMGNSPPPSNTPVVAMASTPTGSGYWMTTTAKTLPPSSPVPSVLAECNLPTAGPVVQPSAIVLACGDGNASLTYLTWSSWTPTAAAATGYYRHNTCTPDCADGTFVSVPASVHLAYPIQTPAGKEFASISYTYADPSAPGGSSTRTAVIATVAG